MPLLALPSQVHMLGHGHLGRRRFDGCGAASLQRPYRAPGVQASEFLVGLSQDAGYWV